MTLYEKYKNLNIDTTLIGGTVEEFRKFIVEKTSKSIENIGGKK